MEYKELKMQSMHKTIPLKWHNLTTCIYRQVSVYAFIEI